MHSISTNQNWLQFHAVSIYGFNNGKIFLDIFVHLRILWLCTAPGKAYGYTNCSQTKWHPCRAKMPDVRVISDPMFSLGFGLGDLKLVAM